MDSFITVAGIMIVLVAFLFVGLFLKRAGLVKSEHVSSLIGILLYAGQSMLSAKPFVTSKIVPDLALTEFMLVALAVSLAGQIIVFLVARLVFIKYKRPSDADIYTFAAVFSNAGFVGLPFLEMLTGGNDYALIFGVIYNVAFNMLIWTLGIYILTGDVKAISIRKAFVNPAILPLLVAIPMFYFPIINVFKYQPYTKLVTYLADLCAPLSMIIVGIRMSEMNIKELFSGAGVYVSAGLRLIVAPLLLIGVAMLLKLTGYFEGEMARYALSAPVLLMSLPPAASLIVFTERCGRDSHPAVKSFLGATLISVITVPLIAMLMTAVGLL